MKTFSVLLITVALISFVYGKDLLTLTAENFDSTLVEHPIILVDFYAPWCGHCKKLAPEIERAATILLEKNIPAKIAEVDADDAQNTELRNRFQIQGFPTLKFFRNGVSTDYQGERTAEAIVAFLKKQSQPASTVLTTVDDAKKFSEDEKVVIIGFFDNAESAEYTSFKATSNQLRDQFSFGEVVGNAEINAALGAEKIPSVVLFKKFDEKRNVLEGSFDTLIDFLKAKSVPIIDEIGPQNFKSYMESGLPLGYLFVDLTVDGQKDQFLAEIYDLAKDTKGRMNWVYIDWAKYARHAERLGLSGKTVPCIAIEKLDEGTHYVFDETAAVAKDAVTQWANKFLGGDMPPTIKSEPIPEDNSGPVKTLVANNFNEIVNDKAKNVFVEFYAPWCGHCKKLAPIFEELGTAFKSADNIVIAKIDATANDVNPKFGIKGFPTLKLFTAADKDHPVEYNGDRSLSDMTSFIQQNTGAVAATDKDEL